MDGNEVVRETKENAMFEHKIETERVILEAETCEQALAERPPQSLIFREDGRWVASRVVADHRTAREKLIDERIALKDVQPNVLWL